MQMLLELEESKVIVQHNSLINSRFDISATELRLFLYMLSKIDKNDTEFKLTEVPISFLSSSTGGMTYKLLKASATNLLKKTFEIEFERVKGKKKWVGYNIFSQVEYIEGTNSISACFNDKIKDFLLNLKGNFTSTQLKYLIKLNSAHSFRLYWLLKQYKKFGERNINYQELRSMLMLSEKYSLFSDFRTKVLNKAQKDLATTDVKFEYRLIKKGRSVDSIRFILKASDSTSKLEQPKTLELTEMQQKAYNAMVNNGLDKKQAEYYITRIEPLIITKMIHNAQLKYLDKKIENKAAYIVAELKKKM
jgi:plasmid replication initiation protein